MIVQDVMNTDVKTIAENSSVQEAAEQMKKYRIGSLIVIHDSKMIGILTERNIMDNLVAEAADASKVKVKDIMRKDVVMVNPEKDITDAAQLMIDKNIKKLPVIKNGKLVGIITASDICASEPKLMEQISTLMLVAKKKVVAG